MATHCTSPETARTFQVQTLTVSPETARWFRSRASKLQRARVLNIVNEMQLKLNKYDRRLSEITSVSMKTTFDNNISTGTSKLRSLWDRVQKLDLKALTSSLNYSVYL